MARTFIIVGTISGFLSVLLGAFAAHGLKNYLTEQLINTFKTAVEYQFMHSLALILIAVVITIKPDARHFSLAGWSLLAGILLFSGSLYLYVMTGLVFLTALTPVGGVAFLVGWASFARGSWKAF